MSHAGKTAAAKKTADRPYALERLYADQDRDWVIDTIPAVVAWVPGKSASKATQPFRFPVEHVLHGGATTRLTIALTWDLAELAKQEPGVEDHARRLRDGKTVQREHVTELAAYGLTLVAMAVLMPGVRVKGMQKSCAPDFLFDMTPGALRGVETAGRSSGGLNKLLEVRNGVPGVSVGKAAQLQNIPDLVEAHLSLWCASARIAIMEQVKP